jgi:hypothetical protein
VLYIATLLVVLAVIAAPRSRSAGKKALRARTRVLLWIHTSGALRRGYRHFRFRPATCHPAIARMCCSTDLFFFTGAGCPVVSGHVHFPNPPGARPPRGRSLDPSPAPARRRARARARTRSPGRPARMRPERRGSIGTPARPPLPFPCVRAARGEEREGNASGCRTAGDVPRKRRRVCRASEVVRGDMRAQASGGRETDGRTAVLAAALRRANDPCLLLRGSRGRVVGESQSDLHYARARGSRTWRAAGPFFLGSGTCGSHAHARRPAGHGLN